MKDSKQTAQTSPAPTGRDGAFDFATRAAALEGSESALLDQSDCFARVLGAAAISLWGDLLSPFRSSCSSAPSSSAIATSATKCCASGWLNSCMIITSVRWGASSISRATRSPANSRVKALVLPYGANLLRHQPRLSSRSPSQRVRPSAGPIWFPARARGGQPPLAWPGCTVGLAGGRRRATTAGGFSCGRRGRLSGSGFRCRRRNSRRRSR